jgi:hypothetical protein
MVFNTSPASAAAPGGTAPAVAARPAANSPAARTVDDSSGAGKPADAAPSL